MKSETLYNGIQLPEEWPPRNINPDSREPMPVPYLDSPPSVIPIDVGRQLFVDDFLIEQTTLKRTFYKAEKYEQNPVLKPETSLEFEGGWVRNPPGWKPASSACPFDDGVFYDPKDRLFKMWYMAGTCRNTALAYSQDGIHWERPKFDVVKDTNCVIAYDPDFARDSFSPWLDHEASNPSERFKMFYYTRSQSLGDGGWLYTSADGIHWNKRVRTGGSIGDNTNLFYNPFRKKWGLSIRRSIKGRGRARFYWEHDDFLTLAEFDPEMPVYWVGADRFDESDPDIGNPPQLYCVAPVAYESITLGVFTVHYGPENDVCWEGGFPKLTELKLGYSRDGFHWARPDREVFIEATKKESDWDRGYLRAAGGGCLVVDDRLYFYYCGFSGISPDGERHMYAGGSTHVAFLRRDGFASMDADEESGDLLTRPVTFTGKYLFVNARASKGELRVEVLDENNRIIEPFLMENCIPITADKTFVAVRWRGVDDLSSVSGKPVRFKFTLTNASLYAFWVSQERSGASYGFVAGGPGFKGPLDTLGNSW